MCAQGKIWAQLFETYDVGIQRIVKTLVIKYGIYTNIFAEKMNTCMLREKFGPSCSKLTMLLVNVSLKF